MIKIESCKYCIHKGVCDYWLSLQGRYLSCDKGMICSDFVNKNNVIVLPCKVGDKIFMVDKNLIRELEVESIHCYSSGYWKINAHTDKRYSFWKSFEIDFRAFGKTVFLNREESEKALRSR